MVLKCGESIKVLFLALNKISERHEYIKLTVRTNGPFSHIVMNRGSYGFGAVGCTLENVMT